MKVTLSKQVREFLYMALSKKRGEQKDMNFDARTRYDDFNARDYFPAESLAVHQKCANVLAENSIDCSDYRYNREASIDISKFNKERLDALRESFKLMKGIRGASACVQDILAWSQGQDTTGMKKAVNVKHAHLLIESYFAAQKHQRLYHQDAEHPGVMRAYHLASVTYHPAQHSGRWYSPPHLTATLAYREFGQIDTESVSFYPKACNRKNAIDIFRDSGWLIETPELRAAYVEQTAQWKTMIDNVGMQCLARGQADDDVDGNENSSQRSKSWWWNKNTVMFDPLGEPSRVVVDVFYEEKEPADSSTKIDQDYWRKKAGIADEPEEAEEEEIIHDDEDEEDDEGNETTKARRARLARQKAEEEEVEEDDTDDSTIEERRGIEIPIHPTLAVFDMKRHMRMRAHLSQLELYKYDVKLGERLILPADMRDLLSVLLTQKSMFADVVAGKGGGIVVLCAGPPGTGKTLTSEIYAEVMRRPLYMVQTAQLGTQPLDLENSLRKIFARAQRWGAILLLDEADVYVRERGDDFHQNAIVGVFLRTLEYYQGILFMTTNRIDKVDDAIASRCIAKLTYAVPTINDQKKIWRVLADVAEVPLSNDVIDVIATRHDKLSGRDIKMLLKLAKMMCASKKSDVTPEMIDLVARFKSTNKEAAVYADRDGGALELPKVGRAARSVD